MKILGTCKSPFIRRTLAALTLCLTSVTAGCGGDEVGYTYFDVTMEIDSKSVDDNTRKRIASCALLVEGDDQDEESIRCPFAETQYKLGTANFSTNIKEGRIRFVLTARNSNGTVIAEGKSSFISFQQGEDGEAKVVAVLVADEK